MKYLFFVVLLLVNLLSACATSPQTSLYPSGFDDKYPNGTWCSNKHPEYCLYGRNPAVKWNGLQGTGIGNK